MSLMDNLSSGSSLYGSPLSLSSGMSSGAGGISTGGALGLGAGALGAAGLGYLISQGPGQLPGQFGQSTANAGWEASAGQQEFGQGQTLEAQGQSALAMAQAGQLTPEQQAQLSVYQTGLTNQSRQQEYSMGLNPDQNTGNVTATANIDTMVNAMSQQQIQSTIALGLGEIQQGGSLMAGGSSDINAANQALIAAGQAQVQLDQQYSQSLSSAFGAIGSMFGTMGGVALKAALV